MTVYEVQSYMTNYEDRGIFDDFNEMAIQCAVHATPYCCDDESDLWVA